MIKPNVIKAVIFDCFGVLVEAAFPAFFREFLADQPDTVAEIKKLDNLSSKGLLPWSSVEAEIARLTGLERSFVAVYLSKNPPNLLLFDYIAKELRPRHKIGFLSNAAENYLDELFTKEQQALFDDFVISYEHLMSKPAQEIYDLAAKRLGVDTQECIFVDDNESYCEGARQAGMQAVHYQSLEQLQSDLRNIIN